mgnify:CR=1 FL=1|jgi:hypothetical protein
MRKYLFIFLVAMSLEAQALEKDKLSHVAGSSVLSFASYGLLKDSEHPMAYSIGITMAVDLAGELNDRRRTGHAFSVGDLTAGFVGAVAGAYIGKAVFYRDKQLVYKKEF